MHIFSPQILPSMTPIFTPHSWSVVGRMVKGVHAERLTVLDLNDINTLSFPWRQLGIKSVMVSVVSSRYGFFELVSLNPTALANSVYRAASLGLRGAQSLMFAHQEEGSEQGAAPAWGAIQWLQLEGVPKDIETRLITANKFISSQETEFLPFEKQTMLLDARYGELIVVNFKSWSDVFKLWGFIKIASSRGAWFLLSAPGATPHRILLDVCLRSHQRVLLQDGKITRQGACVLLG